MKKNLSLIFAALLATRLLADQPAPPITTPATSPAITNASSASPSDTNTPAAKAEKKKAAKKKTAKAPTTARKSAGMELKTVPLIPGSGVVIASNVNVRGKAGLKGEVLGRVTKSEPVTVLEEIILKNSGPDEPSAWAKITLPPSIHVWVNSSFLEASNKTVRPKKLNVRGGPGENFSVLGTLKRGDTVKELSAKGDWLEIEPPADAFAFVAAQYLKQEAPAIASVNPPVAPVEPAPTPTVVPETAPVTPAVTETPPVQPATQPPTVTDASPPAAATAPPAEEEPLPPRIVQREGVVRGTFSIQAPTHFELVSPDNGRTINYLHTTSRDLDLRRYKGLRIIVTGEEGLDERWHNTPVITIQRIQVLE